LLRALKIKVDGTSFNSNAKNKKIGFKGQTRLIFFYMRHNLGSFIYIEFRFEYTIKKKLT
jgi:hypothetical protein